MSKPYIHNSSKGFTFIELLVGMLVASIVVSMGFSALVYNRKLYLEDEARNTVNQNLRIAMDLVGTDIKQAGERLTDPNFPVVRITNSGGNSTLILLRKLDLPVLPVCAAIRAGFSDPLFMAQTATPPATPPAGCNPLPDTDGDAHPDNLGAWRNHRCRQDGVEGCQGNSSEWAQAYIYDGTGNGEFFDFVGEGSTTFDVRRRTGHTWTRAYNTSSSVYLLEKRQFSLSGNTLQLSINDQTPLDLVKQLTRFEVRAFMQSGTPAAGKTIFPQTGDSWQQIQNLQVNLTAQSPNSDLTSGRNLTASSRFFPRNVLSR